MNDKKIKIISKIIHDATDEELEEIMNIAFLEELFRGQPKLFESWLKENGSITSQVTSIGYRHHTEKLFNKPFIKIEVE